jgi:hypothetical protein
MDQLSRRLHQFQPPALAGGSIGLHDLSKSKGCIAMLSSTDAAYIAGLIDGEGTVTLTRKHRNENRQLCVSISSTERPMLEFVKQVLMIKANGSGKRQP